MTGAERDEVAQYVERVTAALADLPPDTRQQLLEDLPEHLTEVLAESGGPLTDRLGVPEQYAAELRGAAGAGAPQTRHRSGRWAAVAQAAQHRLATVDTRLGPLVGQQRVTDFLALLRPAWWVLRGYLAAMLVAFVLDDSGQPIGLLPRIGGSEAVALLLLAAGVLGSVWLGRRERGLRRWPRHALRSATVLLALVAVSGFLTADASTRDSYFDDVGYHDPYSHIDDVYVYDGNGRLLTGVRLFDQNGQPIRLGNGWCSERDVHSEPVPSYPYCPDQAPFRAGSGPAEPTEPSPAEPTGPSPADSAEPAPTGDAQPGPPVPGTGAPNSSPAVPRTVRPSPTAPSPSLR